ncbi:hypothetical protein [Lactovum odontotermitis]
MSTNDSGKFNLVQHDNDKNSYYEPFIALMSNTGTKFDYTDAHIGLRTAEEIYNDVNLDDVTSVYYPHSIGDINPPEVQDGMGQKPEEIKVTYEQIVTKIKSLGWSTVWYTYSSNIIFTECDFLVTAPSLMLDGSQYYVEVRAYKNTQDMHNSPLTIDNVGFQVTEFGYPVSSEGIVYWKDSGGRAYTGDKDLQKDDVSTQRPLTITPEDVAKDIEAARTTDGDYEAYAQFPAELTTVTDISQTDYIS